MMTSLGWHLGSPSVLPLLYLLSTFIEFAMVNSDIFPEIQMNGNQIISNDSHF